MAAFDNWAVRRHAARIELGAGEGDILVGIVGRLTEVKNHELFLQAVARYGEMRHTGEAAADRRVRFLVIGDGHLREELEMLAHVYGVDEAVTFTGTARRPRELLPGARHRRAHLAQRGDAADAHRGDGERARRRRRPPWAASSICSAGRTSPSSGTTARGASASAACASSPRDAESFAHALAYLVEGDELRGQLGERGRRFVEENYSVGRLLADVRGLYEDLTNPPRSGAASASRTTADRVPRAAARLKGD